MVRAVSTHQTESAINIGWRDVVCQVFDVDEAVVRSGIDELPRDLFAVPCEVDDGDVCCDSHFVTGARVRCDGREKSSQSLMDFSCDKIGTVLSKV